MAVGVWARFSSASSVGRIAAICAINACACSGSGVSVEGASGGDDAGQASSPDAAASEPDAAPPGAVAATDAGPRDGTVSDAAASPPAGDSGSDVSAPPVSAASAAKKEVLAYFASIKGKETVSGQHDKNNPTPTDGTDQVTSITGKQAALWSADFGFGQDNVGARPLMITQAQAEWTKGSIVQLMYHNCVPTGDELCSWDDIGGATPQHLTDAQWTDLVTDGGTLNHAWKARLDTLSIFFTQLQAAGVAPLFRPLHEMNQPVFWWAGRPGAQGTRRLYQITHDYLVGTKGFDNIIWVWDVQDFSTLATDVSEYDPGSAYYDIAALDVYDGGYDVSKYTTMQGAAGSKPIAIGECSTPPTSAELSQQPQWAFFMLWPDFISQNASALPALYAAPNVVTLDGMPGW